MCNKLRWHKYFIWKLKIAVIWQIQNSTDTTAPSIFDSSYFLRWAGHVVPMCEERGCIGSWWGNRREGDQWGDLGVDGWIILGWMSRRWDVGIWTG